MSDKRFTIGLFICHLDNDYAFDICKGVDYAAKELDANLIIFPGMYINAVYNDQENAKYDYQYNSIFYYAKPESIDALIISIGTIGTFLDDKDCIKFLEQFKGIPILTLESEFPGYPSLINDSTQGLKDVINHLIYHHNKKHIGFVSGRPGNSDAEERLAVYKSTLTAAGLPVDEKLIVHGNFSEYCEELVEDLLDSHPEIDALCFANDQMALGGYNVLKRRGIEIGRDIAVTGFDDSPLALALDPALSTVRANACELGYRSVHEAIHLIKTGHTTTSRLNSSMILRESCGCNSVVNTSDSDMATELLAKARKELVDYIVALAFTNDKDTFIYHRIESLMCQYVSILLEAAFDGVPNDISLPKLLTIIKQYINSDIPLYFSIVQMNYCLHAIENIILSLIKNAEEKLQFCKLAEAITTQLLTTDASLRYNEKHEYKVNIWSSSYIIRDTLTSSSNLDLVYTQIGDKMQKLNLKSSYVYTTNEEIRPLPGGGWSIPKSLRLQVYNKDEVTISMAKDEYMIDIKDLFWNPYVPQKRRFTMILTPIFTSEEHHGVFLCEVDISHFHHIYSISLELGTALKFLQMAEEQQKTNQQLEYTLSVLHEKNRQLSKISTIDELTELKNRRGFMTETQAVITSPVNRDQRAILLFADMDNLKTVNDKFGHEDGDFALRTIATALKSSMRNDDIIGRIGGDEFVAFALLGNQQSADTISNRIHAKLASMNENCDKPYYIDASIGYVAFICNEDSNIQTLLKQADIALYEAKSHKRKSVLKENF